jgi:hypothetical protein
MSERFRKGDRIVFRAGNGPKTYGTVVGYEYPANLGRQLLVAWDDGKTDWTLDDKDVSKA